MYVYTPGQWALLFFFYCFCGWVWESCYVSAKQRHWVNRDYHPDRVIAPLDVCTEKLKQASRNYAKRQLTWFRHMDGVVWLDASAPDVTARAVQLTQEFLAKG